MMIEHRRMNYFWAAATAAGLLASACTQANPRSCTDGTCTDPAFPFCDVDGALAGEPKVCIAVSCTAGEFNGCRGDTAIVCNEAGADYDLVQCEMGCDETAGGCHLCEPNQTACTNGKVASCDATGHPTVKETCALGCFEDQPRCREMVPSNNLGTYLDMVPSAPAMELTTPTIDVYDGSVRVGSQTMSVPSFVAAGSGNGADIRVFVVKSLKLHGAQIVATGTTSFPTYAVAFIAAEEISIDGEVDLNIRAGGATKGCGPAMAGHVYEETPKRLLSSGGGGGGNGTAGGRGGDGGIAGGTGDGVSGSGSLVPLRGGCSGGVELGNGLPGEYPTGGGAIQLSAGRSLSIDGVISVRGDDGQFDQYLTNDLSNSVFIVGGGGAGGSVLVEAPNVVLGADARINARGGAGFQACSPPTMYCAAAGAGATAQQPAGNGSSAAYMTAILQNFTGGGGGGGLGRLRVNTGSGQYTKASSTVEDAIVSAGTVQTR
jgi:hypothetical protein